jgi:hypothetical protein
MSGWGSGYYLPSVGRGWDGTGRAAGGHSVGVVETRPKAQAAVPSEQFGQVSEILSWDRDTRVSEIVIIGDTARTPSEGRVYFGRKMVGDIIEQRTQPGEYDRRRCVDSPAKLILKVQSDFCPSIGARIRPYVEPRATQRREPERDRFQR